MTRAGVLRAGWKRTLQVLLGAWLVLGSLAYTFSPAVLTGHRAVDAVLVSAIVTVLLAELVEVLGTLVHRVFFGRDSQGPA